MTEINTLQRGLSALLQVKSQNDIPKSLFDEVMLSVESFRMLFEGCSPETIFTTVAGLDSTTAGGVNTIDAQLFGFKPSDNEMIFCQYIGLKTFSANALVKLRPMGPYVSWPIGGGTQGTCVVDQPQRGSETVVNGFNEYMGARDLWVPPGGSFGFFMQTITSAPATSYSAEFSARFIRLRV